VSDAPAYISPSVLGLQFFRYGSTDTLNSGSAYRARAHATDRVGVAAHGVPDVIVPLQQQNFLLLDSRRIRWPIGGRFCLGRELGDLPLDGCMKP